jgi:hypothetical protein
MFYTTPTHAVHAFGQDSHVFYENQPLHKFLFAVVLNFNPVSGVKFDTDRMTLIVKNVDIGGWKIDTEVLNEYNRDRIVHKKMQYDDTTITMHDVADGKALRLAEKYYRYYFGDGRDAVGFGYDTILIPDSNKRYLIDSIDIFQFQAGKANQTTLMYPKMVSFKHDTADYSGIDELMEMSFTFKPEYIKYERKRNIPKSILKEMERGGTQEDLAALVDTALYTEPKKDSEQLKRELLDDLANDTRIGTRDSTKSLVGGTAFTTSIANELAEGSTTVKASTSSLDSYGRLKATTSRKIPSSNQKPLNKTFSLSANKVANVDGNNTVTQSNNDYNFQGGDD